MNKFKVEESEGLINITDLGTKYVLTLLNSDTSLLFHQCTFKSSVCEKETGNFVTARNLNEYDEDIRNLEINPGLQYAEVGSGLGAFVPYLVRNYSLKHKPIVIDPVNYLALYSLIEHGKSLKLGRNINQKLDVLEMRCVSILEPKNVLLINMTLKNALHYRGDLRGIADVVVDNAGASHYMNDHNEAWELERQLLKDGGLLYSEVVKSGGVFTPEPCQKQKN